ncbi:unnamed protein product [Staurois parvus]|uniref:Uncharacterized protein n=1 Tax=Staurois parvus TaxID=386267 RepID=A0ABN9CA18_9NEOB|nr:unnamed protein product [Staurois parvus]
MLIKSTDTILMTLGRKALTSGAIKGLTVCCAVFSIMCCVCVLHCKHTNWDGCTVHSHPEQCARADREEDCL